MVSDYDSSLPTCLLKIPETDGSAPANMGQRKREGGEEKGSASSFFLPLPLKIAKPPDCTGLRFQGNRVHSQLFRSCKGRGVGGRSGCEVLSSSIFPTNALSSRLSLNLYSI